MGLPFPVTLKTYLGIILLALTIVGIRVNGFSKTIPQLLTALATCIILDILINYIKNKRIILPDSAVISALFIATALSIEQEWYIILIASAVAILSKHLIKINNKHIFNPANFGLFAVILIFNATIQWWAAQILILVVIFGLLLTWKIRRFHLILSYFITGVILSLIHHLIKSEQINFSILLFSTNIFFMFFMLVEPITSPVTKKGRVIYGILTALFAFIILLLIPKYEISIFALVLADLFVPLLNKLI